jgi:hypothetical protein
MSDALETNAPDLKALEIDIADTRRSLEQKIDEIGRRMQPEHVKAEVKDLARRRLNPQPYLGYIASGLVALGCALALRAWRRSRRVVFTAGEYPMPM